MVEPREQLGRQLCDGVRLARRPGSGEGRRKADSVSVFTPGPWELREGPNDSHAFDVYAGLWKVHHGAWGREADARLISAAPELLEIARHASYELAVRDMS